VPVTLPGWQPSRCLTGLETTAIDVREWTKEEVDQYQDDPLEVLGITGMIEPIDALNVEINGLEKEVASRASTRADGCQAHAPTSNQYFDHARSKRSRFMTLSHAATKSRTNVSCESSHA